MSKKGIKIENIFHKDVGQVINNVERMEVTLGEGAQMMVQRAEGLTAQRAEEAAPQAAEGLMPPPEPDTEEGLKRALTPMFKGDGEAVERFVAAVKTAKTTDIPKIASQCLTDGLLAPWAKNKELWSVLHEQKIYAFSLTNWNNLIK